MTTKDKRVQVYVRTLPTVSFANDVINFDEEFKVVNVRLPSVNPGAVINNKKQEWNFDVNGVVHNSSQEDVYSQCAGHLVKNTLSGVNGCILAYGQIGTGKTYTMIGPHDNYHLRGIIPRAISQIFQESREREGESLSVIRVSYIEIYNERIIDLLTTQQRSDSLTLNETPDGVTVTSLTLQVVENEEDAFNLLFQGEMNRTVDVHPLNRKSSRSHVIFSLYVETKSHSSASAENTVSKLHLVDLGGFERLSKSQSTTHTAKEAIYINKSLSFLEQVILCQAESKCHYIPYRQSKLTHFLSDSLCGNCNTVLIANISGELIHIEETISTLKFATRIKCLLVHPISNMCLDSEKLARKYEQEIETLKLELMMQNLLENRGLVSYDPLSEAEVTEIHQQVTSYLNGSLPDLQLMTVRETKEAFSQFKTYISSIEKSYNEEMEVLQEKIKTLENKLAQKSEQTDDRPGVGKELKAGSRKSVTYTPSASEGDQKQYIGEKDGKGISVGHAPSALKQTTTINSKSKMSVMPRISIMDTMKKTKASINGDEEVRTNRPSTPPLRLDAFELFKKGKGKELNKIFLQNKDLLQRKEKQVLENTYRINQLKKKLDELNSVVNEQQEERKHQVSPLTSDGRLVITEREYVTLLSLKQIKGEYKTTFNTLQLLQSELPFCEQYTQQSRNRLIKEFDVWYKSAFIGECSKSEKGFQQSVDKVHDLETSIKCPSYPKGDLSSIAYYKASLRSLKRTKGLLQKKPIIAT